MATEHIDIVVTDRGTRRVKRNIAGIGQAGRLSAGAIVGLNKALTLVGSGIVLTGLVRMLDTFTNFKNRVRNVTSSQGELNVVMKELLDISTRTRSSFEGTAEVYARTALAVKDLGISQAETLQFTESLNQAVILSGASAIEAKAAMIQLSQGLASNTLRGDELRSVLEQLPAVADVIAKSFKVTRGELRELGAEGKISAASILKAFREAREELAGKFANTIPTVGQALQVLRTEFIRFSTDIDQSIGVTKGFAVAILALANNIDVLIKGLFVLASSFIGGALFSKMTASSLGLVGVIKKLGPLLLLVFGGIPGLVVGAIAAVFSFSSSITVLGDTADGTAVTLRDVFSGIGSLISDQFSIMKTVGVEAFQSLKETAVGSFSSTFEAADGVIPAIARMWENSSGLIKTTLGGMTKDVDFTFFGMTKFVARFADRMIALGTASVLSFVAEFRNMSAIVGNIFAQVFNSISRGITTTLNFMRESLNGVQEFLGLGSGAFAAAEPLQLSTVDVKKVGSALGSELRDQLENGPGFFEKLTNTVRIAAEAQAVLRKEIGNTIDLTKEGENLVGDRVDKAKKTKVITLPPTFAEVLGLLRLENDLLTENEKIRTIRRGLLSIEDQIERKFIGTEKELAEQVLVTHIVLLKQNDVLQSIRGTASGAAEGISALNALLKKGSITADEYTVAMRRFEIEILSNDRTVQGGILKGMIQLADEMTNLGDLAANTLVDSFKKAEDALVEFVSTGKLDFKGLVDSIAADITRLAIRTSITGPLSEFLGEKALTKGGSKGGGNILDSIFSGIGSLFGFQHGGDFTVGGGGGVDSEVVAFRATPGENVTINKPGQQQQSEGTTIINFNITTPDAASFQRSQGQILAKARASLSRASSRNA